MHLELDFLPRSLVYNYGDNFAESNKMMENILNDLDSGLAIHDSKNKPVNQKNQLIDKD